MFKHKKLIIFIVSLIILSAYAQENVEINTKHKTTTEPTTTSTSTTPSTTTESTTSSTSTTTSTTSSTTTTTTTTPEPTTTTIAPSTTSAPPKPYPKPSIGFWKSDCVLAEFSMQLNLSYKDKTNNSKYTLYNLPINSTNVDDHQCLNTTDMISIGWPSLVKNGHRNSLSLSFENLINSTEFKLSQMMFNIAIEGDDFPNAAENQTVQLYYKKSEFKAPIHMSYHCTKEQILNLTSSVESNVTVAVLTVAHLQLEAFRNKNTDRFSTAKDCDAIDTPDLVPIAVGCALAGLVVIVLIAYLVGRRRSQARGYLSM